jgi:hypothetical protein
LIILPFRWHPLPWSSEAGKQRYPFSAKLFAIRLLSRGLISAWPEP